MLHQEHGVLYMAISNENITDQSSPCAYVDLSY